MWEWQRPRIDLNQKCFFLNKVKIALEIPDLLYGRFKASAECQGRSVGALLNEAIAEKLQKLAGDDTGKPSWQKAFGQLRHLRTETRHIEHVIREEFSSIDRAKWKTDGLSP